MKQTTSQGKKYRLILAHLYSDSYDISFFDVLRLFLNLSFTGGKGVKKAIKKVASGLVRDAEKTWFSELSDKGEVVIIIKIKVRVDRE